MTAEDGAAGFDEVARVTHRLAVLLEAGLAPASSWQQIAAAPLSPRPGSRRAGSRGGSSPSATARIVAAIAADVTEGHAAPDAIRMALPTPRDPARRPWAALLAAWQVSTAAGAPIAPTLSRMAGVFRGLADGGREIETALAGPIATTRIVVALPLVGLLLGFAMGFDVIGTLFGTPAGLACVAVGGILLGVAALWTRRMVASARRLDPTPGLALDLIAVAVSGGGSLDRALEDVDAALVVADLPGVDVAARAVVAFSRDAGVPAGALLRAEAEEVRRAAAAEGRRGAARLGVRLMLPLGACVLPAFLALGVIPVMLSLLTSTIGAL